jgi:hypothetical protein
VLPYLGPAMITVMQMLTPSHVEGPECDVRGFSPEAGNGETSPRPVLVHFSDAGAVSVNLRAYWFP